LVNNAFDVRLGSPCGSAVRIPEEVTTKMIGDLPNSLELVLSTSEFLEEKVRIGHNAGQVINIDTNKFIMCTRIFHPNIRICLARIESHIHESTISKAFMPSGSTSRKSIESLDNDEQTTLEIPKFGSSSDEEFLFGVGHKIGIANICSINI
jgi:hypothetical protein